MEEDNEKFDINGMLDSKREVAEKLGFYEEAQSGFIRKQIMFTYKKDYVKLYHLNSLTWSPEEGKFILRWTRRMSSMELSDEDYEKEFGFLRINEK